MHTEKILNGHILLIGTKGIRAGQTLKHAAEKLGYDVEAVDDGASGLKKACQKQFNLVLVAEHLPDTTGIKWVQELKIFSPWVHAVVITPDHCPSNKKNAFIQAGFSGCMMESFDKNEFESMVNALCKDEVSFRHQRLKKCLLFSLILSIPLWLFIIFFVLK